MVFDFHSGVSVKRKAFQILVFICILVIAPSGRIWAEVDSAQTQQEEEARQLRIYRDSLLQGSTEDIRVDAAVGLLLRDDDASRDALVTALKSEDNPGAQQAVCKALIKSRGLGQSIHSRMNYLDPLMGILVSENVDQAVLAAEALLLYTYNDLEKKLTTILESDGFTQQARLNAVYALQIRSEPQSLSRLVGLLDDSDAEVSKAAENALQEAFGIPVGASRRVWDDILKKLEQKSPDDIRRELLLLKETRLRQVQAERDKWQKLYLGALDKQYEIADEAGRGKMTLEMLGNDLPPVRLWALGKVAQYPIADNDEFRDTLLTLLGDASRDVRLETARVLNSMSPLDPAEQLLKQLRKEEDSEVRLAMFEALGEACFYAFSEGSEIVLSEDIKSETMAIASQYLVSEQGEAVKKGAEVIRKILELNNLPKDSIYHYLGLLSERYQQSLQESEVVRSDLLSVMSHLCGQGAPRFAACKLYEPYFVESLAVADQPSLRLAAIKGMIYVDPVKAMALAGEHQLMLDDSLAVRQVVIDLAGQNGDVDELGWLLEALNENGHTEEAWQAIKRICQRQKSGFLLTWVNNLGEVSGRSEYIREILELAEQKAIGEKDAGNTLLARKGLLGWCRQRKSWDSGVLCLEKMGFDPADPAFSEIRADAFAIYLYVDGGSQRVFDVLKNELDQGDLPNDSPFLMALSSFLEDQSVSDVFKRELFEKLSTIDAGERPNWQKFKSNLSNLSHILQTSKDSKGADAGAVSLVENPKSGTNQ